MIDWAGWLYGDVRTRGIGSPSAGVLGRVGRIVPERPAAFTVGLVVPFAGPEAIHGPSCVLCARLATEETNGGGGVLARSLRIRIIDGGGAPGRVAREVGHLVTTGAIDAVVGWHTSRVRRRVAAVLRGRVPYVFTALYEGGETTPGVVPIGETPDLQVFPGLRWMAEEIGVRRWFVVGDDYVWPRRTTAAVAAMLDHRRGPRIDEAHFVGLGTSEFGPVLDAIAAGRSDGVLMLLVGRDAVEFNRQFARRGLEDRCARFTPLLDESVLREIGPAASRDVFTASGYFEALPTPDSLGFGARYVHRFGPDAPVLNAPGESCYEGLRLLAEMVERAGSADVERLARLAGGSVYHGPRGTVRLTGARAEQRIYIAAADGADYDVLDSW